jgi:hypothetical protein
VAWASNPVSIDTSARYFAALEIGRLASIGNGTSSRSPFGLKQPTEFNVWHRGSSKANRNVAPVENDALLLVRQPDERGVVAPSQFSVGSGVEMNAISPVLQAG